MATTSPTGLRRGLSIGQAVGISVALMAPSMAANINPQGTAGLVGRATGQWFPVVAFGWVVLLALAMVLSPGLARRLSVSLEKADEAA